jgi:NhaA family Na+:H+ antiporter
MFLSAGMLIAWWLQRRKALSFWPYVLAAGTVSWMGFYRGGLHPALALVPIVPFLPRGRRDPGLFADAPHRHDTLNEFEHWFKRPVDVMLLCFGLVNAGVVFGNAGAGTWLVLTALLAGKPLGIVGACALAGTVGLRLPNGVTWRDVTVLGIIAAIGFTVALFFATAAFPYGRLLDETKLGALLSFSAFLVGVVAARTLKVGRFR